MKRWLEAIRTTLRGLVKAVSRFPLTVLCLIGATVLVWYMISLDKEPDLIIEKLMFTFLLGAFLGVAAQFSCERFKRLGQKRIAVYGLSTLATLGYYFIIAAAPNISFEVEIRTVVAVFAMFCAYLWVPSYRGSYDFNRIALIHFKSAFTAVLYSAVLSAGCASIIAAIDILLFNIDSRAYGYTMATIWILFATLYYLSLLPRFNSEAEADIEHASHTGEYPRILDILVSYIAIPLVAAYTLVLAAYFIKILVTLKWPSGQLGGMVLAYSAAGLMIYILASLLTNRFAVLYQKIFPKVLIPVVIMQLISVGIRLNAYGITESRYYVTLFGIASIVCAVILCFKPVVRNSLIVLLVAGFAIISIIPPIDAFTVSRVSQVNRLENMLVDAGILKDGKITPQPGASEDVRVESTSILNYLEDRKYTKSIAWLPNDFTSYEDMQDTFGFEPAYPETQAAENYFFASVDMNQPMDISGYEIMMPVHSYRNADKEGPAINDFTLRGTKYHLEFAAALSKKNTQYRQIGKAGVNLTFQPIKTKKIWEEIVEQLKIMITSGELKPGDKLPSERDMAESMGVSRASVREALITLEAIGILEIKPGEGTFVRQTSDAETFAPLAMVLAVERNPGDQMMEVRQVLEAEMAALAAQRASKENLCKIEKLLAMMKAASTTPEAVEADLRFHFAIAEATQNTILLRLMNTIADLMHHVFRSSREELYDDYDSGQKIIREHEAIYQAIKNRDPQSARDKMLEHINTIKKSIK